MIKCQYVESVCVHQEPVDGLKEADYQRRLVSHQRKVVEVRPVHDGTGGGGGLGLPSTCPRPLKLTRRHNYFLGSTLRSLFAPNWQKQNILIKI